MIEHSRTLAKSEQDGIPCAHTRAGLWRSHWPRESSATSKRGLYRFNIRRGAIHGDGLQTRLAPGRKSQSRLRFACRRAHNRRGRRRWSPTDALWRGPPIPLLQAPGSGGKACGHRSQTPRAAGYPRYGAKSLAASILHFVGMDAADQASPLVYFSRPASSANGLYVHLGGWRGMVGSRPSRAPGQRGRGAGRTL